MAAATLFSRQPTVVFFFCIDLRYRASRFCFSHPCPRHRPENKQKSNRFSFSPRLENKTGAGDCPHCSRQRLWLEGVRGKNNSYKLQSRTMYCGRRVFSIYMERDVFTKSKNPRTSTLHCHVHVLYVSCTTIRVSRSAFSRILYV